MSEIKVEYRTEMDSPDIVSFINLSRDTVLTSRKIAENHVAYVAIIDGNICGALFFTEIEENKEFWIDLSFVREEHRRKGIHTMLFNEVKDHAKNVGMNRIQCEVLNTNLASRAAMEAQGRKAVSTIYRYEIESGDDDG